MGEGEQERAKAPLDALLDEWQQAAKELEKLLPLNPAASAGFQPPAQPSKRVVEILTRFPDLTLPRLAHYYPRDTGELILALEPARRSELLKESGGGLWVTSLLRKLAPDPIGRQIATVAREALWEAAPARPIRSKAREWTLQEAIAWLIWRHPEPVERASAIMATPYQMADFALYFPESMSRFETLEDAEKDLSAGCATGELVALGRRGTEPDLSEIPTTAWTRGRFDWEKSSWTRQSNAERTVPYGSPPTFSGTWFDLAFPSAGVREHWPASDETRDGSLEVSALPDTAAAKVGGRPSYKAAILAEHSERVRRTEAKKGLKGEAAALLNWFAAKFPGTVPPALGTIRNHVRANHRQYLNRLGLGIRSRRSKR